MGAVGMATKKKSLDAEEQQAHYGEISTHLPLLLEVKEVAAEMRTSPAMVYRLINAGVLPVLKLGRIKVPYKAIIEFIDRYTGHDVTNPESIRKLQIADIAQ